MSSVTNKPNPQTWDRVLAGDVTAYQLVVETHQSAVSAVAYSILGDFNTSQDIAQETFWVAWTKRNSLRDVSRLGSWLCGIARNLAKQWRKKHKRRATSAGSLAHEPATDTSDPIQQSIADEEQQLVWNALEQIPDNYREVLTLYYRQGQSIAEVAQALDISEEAARQRLSRGRTMLRGRVSELIEGVLIRGKPGRSFTAKVMAGLTGAGIAAKAGSATAASLPGSSVAGTSAALAAVKGAAATGASVGLLGGALGAIGGLGGAWFGTWLPAQLAQTETERQLLLHRGRVTMGLAIVFTLAIIAVTGVFVIFRFDPLYFVAITLGLSLAFAISITIQAIRLQMLVMKLRRHITPEDDPNRSPFAAKMGLKPGNARVRKGRRYTSKLELFGYPLLDVQFSDADFSGTPIDREQRGRAFGWIACGDQATGILLAIGGVARGFIAFGGVAFGAIAVGGLAIGVLALGGGAIGVIAFGGGALGYEAAGGGAIAWHSAAGGLAVAWHAATGGLAVARDFAVGGLALAAEANTQLARNVLEQQTSSRILEWLVKNQVAFIVCTVIVSLIPVAMLKWIYTLDEDGENEKQLP